MPRYPRVLLKDYPHHLVQRGHDRQPIFAHDADFRVYLKNLREQFDRLKIELFSYCLMTNHVQLLVRPLGGGLDL